MRSRAFSRHRRSPLSPLILPQDETIGLAESDDAHASAYANLDSQVLYRVGETNDGTATYTPRMVYFEMRGGSGASKDGYLYGDGMSMSGSELPLITTWDDSKVKMIHGEVNSKSQFVKQLEEDWEEYETDDEDERDATDDDDGDDGDDDRSGRRGKWGRDEGIANYSSTDPNSTDPMEALRNRMAAHLEVTNETNENQNQKTKKTKPKLTDEELAEKRKLRREKEALAAAKLAEAAEQLEHQAKSWSDFSKAAYHPRSCFLLDGVWSGIDSFAGFGEGTQWAISQDRREDIRDVIRKWAEECDRMNGFQIASEDLSGFGGITSTAIKEIKDEYPTQCVWAFSLRPSDSSHGSGGGRETSTQKSADADAARYRMLNDALACADLAPMTDAYLPVDGDTVAKSKSVTALPTGFTGTQGNNRYRSSALAASYMDITSSSFRAVGVTTSGAADMRTVARHLSQRTGGPFVSASLVLDPDAGSVGGGNGGMGAPASGKLAEADEAARRTAACAPLSKFAGLTPGARGDRGGRVVDASRYRRDDDSESEDEDEPLAETYISRGARVTVGGLGASVGKQSRHASSAEASLALDAAIRLERYRCPRLRCVTEAPLPVPLTFPHVFGGEKAMPKFVSATARLRSSASYGAVLSNVRLGWQRASKSATGKAALRAWGVDDDELEETSERLWEQQRAYAEDDEFMSSDEELEHI